jgi:hypothetical protein
MLKLMSTSNVSHQAISKLLDRLVATKRSPKSLEAFAGRNVRLQLNLDNRVGEAHTRIVWLPSEVVAAIEPPLPDLTMPREAVRILKNSQETKTAYRLFLYLHDVGQQGERPTIAA